MSSLFVLGAGASFGSGPCIPHPPPLGSQLFAALQERGGAAARVPEDLARLFASDFEQGMDEFWRTRNTETSELLRDMAGYFAQFEPGEGNLYGELIRVLGGTKKKATFVTTNYDLLLELAICNAGLTCSYGDIDVPANSIPILKIHGSCNFLPDLGTGSITGLEFDMSDSAPDAAIVDVDVRIARSTAEVVEFCSSRNSIAPAVAMYAPSKRVLYCSRFVQEQQDAWRRSLRRAARIFVIGLRVHTVDEHIWGPLSRAKVPLFYVGPGGCEFLDWAKTVRHNAAYHLANTFEDALPKIDAMLSR